MRPPCQQESGNYRVVEWTHLQPYDLAYSGVCDKKVKLCILLTYYNLVLRLSLLRFPSPLPLGLLLDLQLEELEVLIPEQPSSCCSE